MLYTALIALLRDWFPAKDYNMSSLLTLLSLAEARENDENFKSALDLMFLQIEEARNTSKTTALLLTLRKCRSFKELWHQAGR